MLVCRVSPRRSRVCGGTDYVEHEFGLREHRHVTAVDLMSGGFHALRKKGVLSKGERLTLLRLLKKLGKHAAETRK
jgi:hypothetical protein